MGIKADKDSHLRADIGDKTGKRDLMF